VGQAQYSGLLTPQGTFADDLLVYRLAAAHFLLVVNAGNIQKDYAWIAEHIASPAMRLPSTRPRDTRCSRFRDRGRSKSSSRSSVST
jgi:aminomethyltransferase